MKKLFVIFTLCFQQAQAITNQERLELETISHTPIYEILKGVRTLSCMTTTGLVIKYAGTSRKQKNDPPVWTLHRYKVVVDPSYAKPAPIRPHHL